VAIRLLNTVLICSLFMKPCTVIPRQGYILGLTLERAYSEDIPLSRDYVIDFPFNLANERLIFVRSNQIS
jgi:hypothetical protein